VVNIKAVDAERRAEWLARCTLLNQWKELRSLEPYRGLDIIQTLRPLVSWCWHIAVMTGVLSTAAHTDPLNPLQLRTLSAVFWLPSLHSRHDC